MAGSDHVRLTAADHGLIAGLVAIETAPWGPLTDSSQTDGALREALGRVIAGTTHHPHLDQLRGAARLILDSRGDLGGLRHRLRDPLHNFHRRRLFAAVDALNGRL